jgi:hypothetical protein
MPNPTFFPEGHTPRRNDSKWRILMKILGATIDGGGGGGSYDPNTASNLSGSGSPEGVVTATVGQHYTDTMNGVTYWKMTGSGNTGWV